ncbi:MAG: hypothetical protein DRJ03_12480 [Chloroflexi bacterium]|nr:MAG: hypothetical protein B6I35_04590 [Anaerolineaceae bacterium 4572_32.2]RLC79295.1 MAG: hypothetical protein DRI81_05515 [Chloroflexota bacterium]RLC85144.1 MAG: hypothetical protein DRJ03_12480 [Chloroflexota bacterium]HEY72216.1 hypothetical protein [Thermoflexia bacterium]
MPLPLALAIALPLLGALGLLGLSLIPRFCPYARYVALAAAGFTTILILVFRWLAPVRFIPSLWEPVSLFGATLILQSDAIMQPLAFVLALTTCSALLATLGRADELPSRLAATILALLSAGLVALWAANPLTMIAGWAIYDLLQAVGCITAEGSTRAAVRGLVMGSLATLLLWAGTMLSYEGTSSELWSLMEPGQAQLTLWAAAGILRLWAYPFHLAAPDDLAITSPVVIPLLLGPITGWGLWLRLASANGGAIPGGAWILILAAATLALGGFFAWSCKTARSALPWIGMGATGIVLLAAQLAKGSAVTVISAGSAAWVLGIALLFLNDGLQQESPWWNLPALFGAMALLGMPLTLGFVAGATCIGEIARAGQLGWGVAFFVGNLFLLSALVRRLLLPASFPFPKQRWVILVRLVGQGLPALLLIVAGLYPPLLIGDAQPPSIATLFALPGLGGWLLWAVSLAGGGVLAWQDGNLRPRMTLLLSAAHDLLRLDWCYDAVLGALERGLSVLQAADEVVGGAGAFLWSWLLFLIILLAWGGK